MVPAPCAPARSRAPPRGCGSSSSRRGRPGSRAPSRGSPGRRARGRCAAPVWGGEARSTLRGGRDDGAQGGGPDRGRRRLLGRAALVRAATKPRRLSGRVRDGDRGRLPSRSAGARYARVSHAAGHSLTEREMISPGGSRCGDRRAARGLGQPRVLARPRPALPPGIVSLFSLPQRKRNKDSGSKSVTKSHNEPLARRRTGDAGARGMPAPQAHDSPSFPWGRAAAGQVTRVREGRPPHKRVADPSSPCGARPPGALSLPGGLSSRGSRAQRGNRGDLDGDRLADPHGRHGIASPRLQRGSQ